MESYKTPSFTEFLNESEVLNEKFKSKVVANFFKVFNKEAMYTLTNGLPYELDGIAWSEIPDGVVSSVRPESAKKMMKDESLVILWYIKGDQVTKYRQATFSKYSGRRQDNSSKTKEQVIATLGKKFIQRYELGRSQAVATEKWDKPESGEIAVTRTWEFAYKAIIINLEDLQQYSSVKLKVSRALARKGATALMSAQELLDTNQDRYDKALEDSRNEKATREITSKTIKMIEKITKAIEVASTVKVKELLTFKTPDSPTIMGWATVRINKIDYTSVEILAKLYNKLQYEYHSFIGEVKQWGPGHHWSKEKEEKLLDLLDMTEIELKNIK